MGSLQIVAEIAVVKISNLSPKTINKSGFIFSKKFENLFIPIEIDLAIPIESSLVIFKFIFFEILSLSFLISLIVRPCL